MIKEIEVGGVKHSITLADDMVGSGLKKDTEGLLSLNLLSTHNSKISSGLVFTGNKLGIDLQNLASDLAGSGLVVEYGRLAVSGGGSTGTINVGTGLRKENDTLVLATSGVLGFDAYDQLVLRYGFGFETNKYDQLMISTDLAGSGLRYIQGAGMDVQISKYSGLCFDPSTGNKNICVNIAKRDIGLRLFFNSNGELDVTQ